MLLAIPAVLMALIAPAVLDVDGGPEGAAVARPGPADTPTIRTEPTNRFTLDDVQTARSSYDTTPPWVVHPYIR